uniref:Uncharacterized protein n=1 Tax=Anguilla anguilla TaxID=7936 RepID=A0A0E9PFC7_ANGAN
MQCPGTINEDQKSEDTTNTDCFHCIPRANTIMMLYLYFEMHIFYDI